MHTPDTHPNYQLNCGQYVLYHGTKPVSAPHEEVALLIDRDEGHLQKFGKPETVNQWLAAQRARLARQKESEPDGDYCFMEERLAAMVMLQGRFTLTDLNLCLSNPSAAGALYQRAMAGKLESLDLLGRTQTPDALLT